MGKFQALHLHQQWMVSLVAILSLNACKFTDGLEENADAISQIDIKAQSSNCQQRILAGFGYPVDATQPNRFYSYARANCVGCHGASQSPLFASENGVTGYAVAKNYINLQSPVSSTFYSRSRDGHCGAACMSNGSSMLAALTTWATAENAVNADATCTGTGPTPSPAPSPTLAASPTPSPTPTNAPPVANAGADKSIMLPTSSVSLSGSGSDSDGTVVSYAWTKKSGGAATIASPTATTTSITGLVAGGYVFTLTVTDNRGASSSDEVMVTVNTATNRTPTSNAGADKTITLPTSSVSLAGMGSDPDGDAITYLWSKVTGGAATFSSTTTASTTLTGLVAGSYTFRLKVTDPSNASASDDVVVTVVAAPTPTPTLAPTPTPAAVTFTAYKAVIDNRCVVCHETATNGNFKNLDQNAWLLSPYIVAGKPDDSRLYNYLIGATSPTGPKNMPKNMAAIPVAERDIIKNYIAGLQGQNPTCATVLPHFAPAGLLNKREFNYAILDILGISGDHSSFFPSRAPDSMGYDNKGGPFPYNAVFAEALYDKLEELLDGAIANQASYPALFKCGTTLYSNATCFNTLVANLGKKAYRRPLTTAENNVIINASNAITGASAINRLKTAYLRILMSPEFLFKLEIDNGATAVRTLTNYEIVSRLAFLIWSSVPDDTLLTLAAQTQPLNAAAITAQVTRMIADAKGSRFIDAFTEQWLLLGNFANVQPDLNKFPNFSPTLKTAMWRETQEFLRDVLKTKPIAEMLTANYSYLNSELASYYDVAGSGAGANTFTKITLPASTARKGLLSQGTTLMLSFRGQEHKPVLRGSYVLGKILCDTPAGVIPPGSENQPPPPNPQTFKDILIAHRSNPNCAGCHSAMDPIGLAYDHFDGVGKFRTNYGPTYNNFPVDTSESLYGQPFISSYDMTNILVGSDKYYECVAKNSYAFSIRVPDLNDEKCEVKNMALEMKQQNLTLIDFIKKLVVKDQFIKRKPE